MTINLKRGPPPTKAIPKCLVINARSLAKPDAPSALYTEMISNNIDICFVLETWLHDNISSQLICPNRYGILRNDHSTPQRGVQTIYYNLLPNQQKVKKLLMYL